MQYSTPLIRGTLVKRYKRFLADVTLENGEVVTAHCPNTGAMTGCAEPGFTVYLSESNNRLTSSFFSRFLQKKRITVSPN